jgi:hypothetical protein
MRHSKNYRDGQRHLHPVPSSGAVSAAGDPFHAAGEQRHRHCPICFDTGETVLLAIGDDLEDDVYIPWLCPRCHRSHTDKLSRFLSLPPFVVIGRLWLAGLAAFAIVVFGLHEAVRRYRHDGHS